MSRVFVVRRLSDDKVVGYYVLTTGSVLHADASRRLTVGTGGYDIPLVILTGPGVDLSEQGPGARAGARCRRLPAHRLHRPHRRGGRRSGALIHAEDADARGFYLRLAAFEPSPVDEFQLLLLLMDLRKALRTRLRAPMSSARTVRPTPRRH
jgi:hypothetical protein